MWDEKDNQIILFICFLWIATLTDERLKMVEIRPMKIDPHKHTHTPFTASLYLSISLPPLIFIATARLSSKQSKIQSVRADEFSIFILDKMLQSCLWAIDECEQNMPEEKICDEDQQIVQIPQLTNTFYR